MPAATGDRRQSDVATVGEERIWASCRTTFTPFLLMIPCGLDLHACLFRSLSGIRKASLML